MFIFISFQRHKSIELNVYKNPGRTFICLNIEFLFPIKYSRPSNRLKFITDISAFPFTLINLHFHVPFLNRSININKDMYCVEGF